MSKLLGGLIMQVIEAVIIAAAVQITERAIEEWLSDNKKPSKSE